MKYDILKKMLVKCVKTENPREIIYSKNGNGSLREKSLASL
jgi:hypothetical protein